MESSKENIQLQEPPLENSNKPEEQKKQNSTDGQSEKEGYYYEAYSELFVHETMLRDSARTLAYKRAICMNRHLLKDKIVLDIGCGVGILSLFAASAGAKTVIGIDCSDIANYAKDIVKKNKFKNIHIVQSKVEEIEQLPLNITEVDVIISEWMGVCLFHESMLGTVVYARDRWLKEDGLLFPDRVSLFLAGAENAVSRKVRVEDWSNVYGFDMNVLRELALTEAKTETIDESQVVTDWFKLREINLHETTGDFSFETDFTLKVNRENHVGALVAYFNAEFSQCHKPVLLSTAPTSPLTHWRQTSFYLDHILHVREEEEIMGKFSLDKYKHNFRDLAIKIEVNFYGEYTRQQFTRNYILR